MLRPSIIAALVLAGARVAFAAPASQAAPNVQPTPTITPLPQSSPSPSQTPSNPFASPLPGSTAEVGANGYAALFVESVSGSGGTYVPANSTAAPVAFPASSGRGFTVDVMARLSRVFEGALRIQDDSLHGGDNPITTVTEGAVLYGSQGQRAAFGVGLISFQRSSGIASATGAGIGAALAPDDKKSVSVFGQIFDYPSLQFSAIGPEPSAHTVHAGLFTYQLGLAFAPPARGGLFYSLGVAGHSGAPSAYSPQSLTAFQLGIGTRF